MRTLVATPSLDANVIPIGRKSAFQYLQNTGDIMGKDFDTSKPMKVSGGGSAIGNISIRKTLFGGEERPMAMKGLGCLECPNSGYGKGLGAARVLTQSEIGAITALVSSYGGYDQALLGQVTNDYLNGDPATVAQVQAYGGGVPSSATPWYYPSNDKTLGMPTNYLVAGLVAIGIAAVYYGER